MRPQFEIGQKFTRERRHAKEETIVDIYTTTNSKGEVVKIRYVTTHAGPFGQEILDLDVLPVTINRALNVPVEQAARNCSEDKVGYSLLREFKINSLRETKIRAGEKLATKRQIAIILDAKKASFEQVMLMDRAEADRLVGEILQSNGD